MRITWLDTNVVRAARDVLSSQHEDWQEHFHPFFEPPPTPPIGVPSGVWPQIAEHVARAERVGQVIRDEGLGQARTLFDDSPHAIELATLVSASLQAEELDFDLLENLLTSEIDELVLYTPFLQLLVEFGEDDRERTLRVYETFTRLCAEAPGNTQDWSERLAAVEDGLAAYLAQCGHLERAHEAYECRHLQDDGDLVVALGASRVFLAAGAVARSIYWLGKGADRARQLERPEMEERLRAKQERLRERLS